MTRLAATLALTLATLGCASAADRARANPDYAVYSTVLDQVYAAVPRTAYLIRPQTHGQVMFGATDMLLDALRRMPQAPESLVSNFLERNRTDVPLDAALFRARRPVQLTGDPALERAMDAQKSGEEFPASAPAHGVLTLSRVGYSPDGARAAVHVLAYCGPLCGGGEMLVLERVGRTWIVLAKRQTVQY